MSFCLAKGAKFLYSDHEDFDQTAWMCTCQKGHFLLLRLNLVPTQSCLGSKHELLFL